MNTEVENVDRTSDGQLELIEGAAREAGRLAHRMPSAERVGFVEGLLNQLSEMAQDHIDRVMRMAELQAQMEIGERNLIATRDYVNMVLSGSKEDLPKGWADLIKSLEFLGMRLGDAAVEVLRRHRRALSLEEIENHLNGGQFRFRTGSPRREIHAALLRQPKIERSGDNWRYAREKEERQSA